jgi:uncharacterized damage-inducible protein DinB
MSPEFYGGVILRDLRALRREVEAFPDERDLWRVPPGVANSAGTLALHLAGNIQHYVGTVLGKTGYVRDRAAEFARRDVPRAEILTQIDAAIAAVETGLAKLTDAMLAADYPEPVAGHTVMTSEWLVHLAVHVGYHLGQVDYHRRIVTGRGDTTGAMAIPELRSARKGTAAG